MIKIIKGLIILKIVCLHGQTISFNNIENGLLTTLNSKNNQVILTSGLALTFIASKYDSIIITNTENKNFLPSRLSQVGDFWGILSPLAVWAIILKSSMNKDYVSNAFAANILSTYAIKSLAQRQRPDGSNNYSFPSGHTSNSFLAAELINQIKGMPLSVPFYLLSINTALSRINDKKHFLSDVIFGAAIGISIGKGFKILRKEKANQRLKDDLEKDFYIHFRWLI
ncbi:MAG: phosphatase PAP2 family protein [bacterium TMED144]|nr:MAG: phosphatase PAP2 family protein [bacterium TMED144]|tara:strand:+ start:2912 stop:3589 length:678 start_codon:yes stop_codon:yes gene_type:complete